MNAHITLEFTNGSEVGTMHTGTRVALQATIDQYLANPNVKRVRVLEYDDTGITPKYPAYTCENTAHSNAKSVKVVEVRYYNGVKAGYDTNVVYQCNFELINGKRHLEIIGKPRANGLPDSISEWLDVVNPAFMLNWYPQIVEDMVNDPIAW